MTTITLPHPKIFSPHRTLAFGLVVTLHLALAIGLAWALINPAATPTSVPMPAPVPAPPVINPAASAAIQPVGIRPQPQAVPVPTPPAPFPAESNLPEPATTLIAQATGWPGWIVFAITLALIVLGHFVWSRRALSFRLSVFGG